MARKNAATREDLKGFMDQGRNSVTGVDGPVPKPSSTDPDIHDNKTSGAGVFVRKAARSLADRRNSRARTPS